MLQQRAHDAGKLSLNTHISIAGRRIGPGETPYIVAELSGNHNGDINRAFKIIDAAKTAGADAVKIQTYRPDTITIESERPEFIEQDGPWSGRSLYELYQEAHTPWEWHAQLFDYAERIGITLFSSPFDPTAIELLEKLNAPAYKIASPELIDLPLIQKVAKTGKPIILSTGMASLEEIADAVYAAREAGANELVVLHCTSAYPTPIEEANLSTMAEISKRFGVPVGLSDHTLGTTTSQVAVALGAVLVEKHVTLSRAEGGVDSVFSLEPSELKILVESTTKVFKSLGKPAFTPTLSEKNVLRNRRSLYIVSPINAGEKFSEINIRSIRPGDGIKPKFLADVLGKRASRNLDFGEPLEESMIVGGLCK